MLKKIRDKRIQVFKETYPDFTTTKAGNFMYKINHKRVDINIEHSGYSVTKGLLKKLGTTETINRGIEDGIVLMCTTGKMLIKWNEGRNFKRMTLKDVMQYSKLATFYFIGRKYEYLENYPLLWSYRLFQNFTSLKEAKMFLGYDFISDEDFYLLVEILRIKGGEKAEDLQKIGVDRMDWRGSFYGGVDIIKILAGGINKVNTAYLISNGLKGKKDLDTLVDYVGMCLENDIPCHIPKGRNLLHELHDFVSIKLAKEKLDKASDVQYYKAEPVKNVPFYEEVWGERGVKFKRVNTERKMLELGFIRKHCIGSMYSNLLDRHSFYTVYWEDEPYEIMLSPSSQRWNQFYGKRNSHPPKDLVDLILVDSFQHKITRIEEAFEKHPIVIAEEETEDLPF
jgi:hypothetical protein